MLEWASLAVRRGGRADGTAHRKRAGQGRALPENQRTRREYRVWPEWQVLEVVILRDAPFNSRRAGHAGIPPASPLDSPEINGRPAFALE